MASGFLGGGGGSSSGPGGIVQWLAGAGVVVLLLVALLGPVASLINNLLTLAITFMETVAPKLALALGLAGIMAGLLAWKTHRRHSWEFLMWGAMCAIGFGVAVPLVEWMSGGSGIGTSLLGAGEHLAGSVVTSIQNGGSTIP